MQPFGYEFVGSDGGLKVLDIKVLVNGDLFGETGVVVFVKAWQTLIELGVP